MLTLKIERLHEVRQPLTCVRKLGTSQWRALKVLRSLEEELGWFSLVKERLKGDLLTACRAVTKVVE